MVLLTGTARLVEIVWLIMYDPDIQQAKDIQLKSRFIFLEKSSSLKTAHEDSEVDHKMGKTHLPYNILSKHVENGTKLVVGLRNPKDTLVSFYNFYTMAYCFGCFKGTFDQFFELFKSKHLAFGDIFDFSLGWWGQRHIENVHVCFYEDLSADPIKEIRKIAEFLGKDLTTNQIESIAHWTSFNNMKVQKSTNLDNPDHFKTSGTSSYMRSGSVGDWKNTLTEEQSKYIDDIYNERCLPAQLFFTFE